ncbi:protein AE7-like 1 [Primulina huaijiensis]|uniref:protein AE7-like 1 n=1 Tax=Primulina huaijiensis TaxID=1492673 RepID=UPI003CC78D5C
MTLGLINANPVVHAKKERHDRTDDPLAVDPFEIYDILFCHLRDTRDPEHPYSLEQLCVLSEESITVDEKLGRILIAFTPTIQHCNMATVIGLCLREKLKDCFPPHFKLLLFFVIFPFMFEKKKAGVFLDSGVDIKVAPGSHANEESVNKQLNDKERVAAALENPNLRQLVEGCLYSSEL